MDIDTDSIILERLMIYQNDLISLYESRMNDKTPPTTFDLERQRQDKAIIAELKRIWYKNGLDGLVYIDP